MNTVLIGPEVIRNSVFEVRDSFFLPFVTRKYAFRRKIFVCNRNSRIIPWKAITEEHGRRKFFKILGQRFVNRFYNGSEDLWKRGKKEFLLKEMCLRLG